jgi:hypothetical protein
MSSTAIINDFNEAIVQHSIELNDYRGSIQTEALVARILHCWRSGEDLCLSFANIDRLDYALLQVLVAAQRLYAQSESGFSTVDVGELVRAQLRMIGAEALVLQGDATAFEAAV